MAKWLINSKPVSLEKGNLPDRDSDRPLVASHTPPYKLLLRALISIISLLFVVFDVWVTLELMYEGISEDSNATVAMLMILFVSVTAFIPAWIIIRNYRGKSPYKLLLRVSISIFASLFVIFFGSAILAGGMQGGISGNSNVGVTEHSYETLATLIVLMILAAALGPACSIIRKYKSEPAIPGSRPRRLAFALDDASASLSTQISTLTDLLLKAKLRGVIPEVTGSIEAVIRKLIVVLPKVSRYKGTELAWVSGRLADDYLFDLVNSYIQLSESGRMDRNVELMEALGAIRKKLDEVDKALDTGDRVSFDGEVRFLKAMISNQAIDVNQGELREMLTTGTQLPDSPKPASAVMDASAMIREAGNLHRGEGLK